MNTGQKQSVVVSPLPPPHQFHNILTSPLPLFSAPRPDKIVKLIFLFFFPSLKCCLWTPLCNTLQTKPKTGLDEAEENEQWMS